jgi:hypothetical protein
MLKMIKQLIEKLKKLLSDRRVQILIAILVIIAVVLPKTESFSKLKRYMYMYNATDKNSSYDTRGDPMIIKKEMDKVGIFSNSSLDRNHRNQRLDKDFKEANDTTCAICTN